MQTELDAQSRMESEVAKARQAHTPEELRKAQTRLWSMVYFANARIVDKTSRIVTRLARRSAARSGPWMTLRTRR